MKRSKSSRILKILSYVLLITGMIVILYPFYLTIITALKTPQESSQSFFSFPQSFYLGNFVNVLQKANYFVFFRNSAVVTLVSVFLIMVLIPMCSYAIARNMEKRYYKTMYFYLLAGIFVPFQVIMVPLVKYLAKLKLCNIPGLIIMCVTLASSQGVFLLVNYIRSVPRDLEEAAYIDGCGTVKAYVKIGELPMLWGRSGYAGSHTIPAAWAGDSSTHLNNHACILRGGLSASMSGIPFWGFDMGGFYNTDHEGYECVPTDEEYIRSCQFGFFNSLSRCHGKTPREPWNFGEKAEKIFKKFNDIRHLLLPYLYSTTYKTHLSDIPVIRPVVMEYPEDRSARNVELEYFLGDSLLVVPVFDQEDEIDVYLPNGQWIDLFTHERIKGGRWVKRKIELDKIPVFIRQNKMIPMLTKIPENIEEKYENLDVILFCEDEIRDTYIDDGNVQNLKAKIEEGTLFINTDMDASYFTVYAEKCLDNAVVNGQNWEIKKEKEGYYKIALEK